jgi:hypothetical protein
MKRKKLTQSDKRHALNTLIQLIASKASHGSALIWGEFEATADIRRINWESVRLCESILSRTLGRTVSESEIPENIIKDILR